MPAIGISECNRCINRMPLPIEDVNINDHKRMYLKFLILACAQNVALWSLQDDLFLSIMIPFVYTKMDNPKEFTTDKSYKLR